MTLETWLQTTVGVVVTIVEGGSILGALSGQRAMKQIAQNYKSGEIALLEVPLPACRSGGVLVRSDFSLISMGTEPGGDGGDHVSADAACVSGCASRHGSFLVEVRLLISPGYCFPCR